MDKVSHPVIVSERDWRDLIGIQFALGGSNPALGLNCYGLVREVYRGLQIELPERQETALDGELAREAAGNDWTRLDEPQPYAVALIRSTGNLSRYHLAVVTPELTLLHSLPKKGVVVSPVSDYSPQITGFFRYAPGKGEPLPVADGNVGRMIGVLLIAVAAAYTGGAAAAAFGGMETAAGAIAGGIAAAVVSVAGNMIINAVAPIKPDTPQLSGWGGDLADSRSYTWDGIVNEARQGLSKAVVFGRVKVGGQIITEKTWFDGQNNEYFDMLLCPAVGRVTRFSGLQINDTDVSLYKNTAPVFRPGDDQQTPIDMFDRLYLQYSSSAKIPYDASATDPAQSVQFSTKSAVSGIRLTVSAPNGIYEMVEGLPVPHEVGFRVQYRPTDGEWSDLPTVDPDFDTDHLFIRRTAGVFTGSANPFTLTDTGGRFDDRIALAEEFELTVGGTTYFCTQAGTLTANAIQFNAFTDAGKTAPLGAAPTNGAYTLTDDTVQPYTGDVTYFIYTEVVDGEQSTEMVVPPTLALETEEFTRAISFRLVIESSTVTWARLRVMVQMVTFDEGEPWGLVEIFDAGTTATAIYDDLGNAVGIQPAPPIGSTYRDISITGLTEANYRVAVVAENSEGGTVATNNLRFERVQIDTASVDGEFVIAAELKNPLHLVVKQIELLDLPETTYDFRIWRTTPDQTDIAWQDDIYLRGYAEIVQRTLSYPNHALIGVRAMATDRLYGGRPRITSICTGAPLTVPPAADRFDTTSVNDLGMVTGYSLINGVVVTGMRKVLVDAELPVPDGLYFWLVRMDSDGFAQPDRLLTKHYLRVHTWEISGSQTYVYLQDAEEIPDGTTLMLFHEAADPYVSRRTAWAVAWALIEGSHGRITESSIDWEAFAEWDVWNMQLKNGQPRHLFDAVVDFNTDLWSLAMRMAATARGNLTKKGSKYSVWIDRAATHRQVFGEGNSNNVSISPIPRADRANILTTSYLNQANSYEQTDVSLEDVQGNEYPIVKNLPVQVGVTRESQVSDLLQFYIDQNRYVGTMATHDAGIDSIEVSIGDVYVLASQAKDFSLSGRLVSVGAVTVTLDQPFVPEGGATYQLTVWDIGGELRTWTGELGSDEITTVPTPAGLESAAPYEYPYVLCKLSEERMEYRCLGIRRAGDTMEATITGIEYRSEIYTND